MNILFINCSFRLFDGIDCGAANRSTMFVKSLSKIGHVDVLNFYKEPLKSNVPNCYVVYNCTTQPTIHRRIEYWSVHLRLLFSMESQCILFAREIMRRGCRQTIKAKEV